MVRRAVACAGWALCLFALPSFAQVQLWAGEAERRAASAASLDFDQFPCQSPCTNLAEVERNRLRLLIEVRLREGVAAINACTDRYFADSQASMQSHARYAKREGILDALERSAAELNYKYACDRRAYAGFSDRPGSLADRISAANMALIDASIFSSGSDPEACREIQSAPEREECESRHMEEQVGEAIYAIAMARITRGACPVDPEFQNTVTRGRAEYRIYAPLRPDWAMPLTPACAEPRP